MRTSLRADRSGLGRHSLGHCWWRERARTPRNGVDVGGNDSRSVRARPRAVLLQAVGWADAEGGRSAACRPRMERRSFSIINMNPQLRGKTHISSLFILVKPPR